jgi:dolichyl-phosphate-mannose--protein O-mannosyl transferase
MLLIAAAAQYIPWMFITRATFIYHYFACLVFVMLCIVYALERISSRNTKLGSRLQALYMVLVLLAFAGFYPFATGVPINRAWADAMNWLKGLSLPWWKFGGWLRY